MSKMYIIAKDTVVFDDNDATVIIERISTESNLEEAQERICHLYQTDDERYPVSYYIIEAIEVVREKGEQK